MESTAQEQPFGEFMPLTPRALAEVAIFLPKPVLDTVRLYIHGVVDRVALPMLRCETLIEARDRILVPRLTEATFLRVAAAGLLWNEAQRNAELMRELGAGVPAKLRANVLRGAQKRLGPESAALLDEIFGAVAELADALPDLRAAVERQEMSRYVLAQVADTESLTQMTIIEVLLLTAFLLFDGPADDVLVPPWIAELLTTLRDLIAARAARIRAATAVAEVRWVIAPLPFQGVSDEQVASALEGFLVEQADIAGQLRWHPEAVELLGSVRAAIRRILGDEATARLSMEVEDGRMRFWVKAGVLGDVDAVVTAQARFEDEWWLDHMRDADGVVSVMVRAE